MTLVLSTKSKGKIMDLNKGVFYSSKDYAGIPRRLFILAIDFSVLACISFVIFNLPVLPGSKKILGFILLAILFITFYYMVVLKRSDRGTLGYLLTGVRIVDLEGNRPSILTMTFRFLLLVYGPFNFILDIFWLGGDKDKQTLRDKVVGTYVINRQAVPVGNGTQKYVQYSLMTYSILFREVSRPTTS
jgi:uncharacterized RDD family membrane protein YckC